MQRLRSASMCVAILAMAFPAQAAFEFNGQPDNETDSLGYYYIITGGKFPTGIIPNGDNASGGTFRFLLDDPAWGYTIDAWQKDDWFPDNAGFALTLKNGNTVVYDNNGIEDGSYGDYYDGDGSHGIHGLYRGYSMANNYDWVYATYFKLDQETTFDTIIGYFDENGGSADPFPFNPHSPYITYRMNIWSSYQDLPSTKPSSYMPTVASFTGNILSSDSTAGSLKVSDTGVKRLYASYPGWIPDPIWRLVFKLAQPVTLPAGVYFFSHDADVLGQEGFVTGGGWINSPEGAVVSTYGATISGVSGDTTVDPTAAYAPYYLRYVGNPPPAGYDPAHNYQWGTPAIVTPSPEDGPVTLQGTIDIGDQVVGQVAMIGLLDRDDLAAGNSSFQRGAYIYIYRSSATTWKIGPSDGNDGGEIVQTFVTIHDTDLPADGVLNVVFTVDGTADGTACAAGPYTAPAGCMTLQITGGSVNATLHDSYGDVVGNNSASPEFAGGAVPGWDDFLGSNVGFSLTVPSIVRSSEGKATFGFASQYKKGALVPTGSTEFQFNAGDINFHSTSYDWLAINKNDAHAQYMGEGTVNGMGPYQFMVWATDGAPDTFRIKIWDDSTGPEQVIYDNGFDGSGNETGQPIDGGNIIVHTSK